MIGSKELPANNIKFAANTIAQLLDPNDDGAADVPEVQRALQVGSKTAPVFTCDVSENGLDSFDVDDDIISDFLSAASGDIAMAFASGGHSPADYAPAAYNRMFHEAHHLVHQQGWAAVWPEIFGDIACSCDNLKACDDTPGACAGDDDDDDDDDWPR